MGKFEPRRFNHKEMGERSEAIVIGRLVYAGYTVLKPYGENQRYDFVIEDADKCFSRVQCKTAWLSKNQKNLLFNTCSNHYAYTWQKSAMTRKHYRGEAEYFAIYSPDFDKVYLLPIEHVGVNQGTLRLEPTLNHQGKHIHWAQEYEL